MKTKVVTIVISSVAFILLAVVLLLPSKSVTIDNIKEMTFNRITGNSINDIFSYSITCEEECKLSYYKAGKLVRKENIDNDKMKELEDMLNKYNVGGWNGFENNNKDVLDGSSFGFSVYMKNGHNIIASGYAEFPKNYNEVLEEFKTLFNVD